MTCNPEPSDGQAVMAEAGTILDIILSLPRALVLALDQDIISSEPVAAGIFGTAKTAQRQ